MEIGLYNRWELLKGDYGECPRLYKESETGNLFLMEEMQRVLISDRPVEGYDIRERTNNGKTVYDIFVKYNDGK